MKNQTFRMTMLFDFYGELLTDRHIKNVSSVYKFLEFTYEFRHYNLLHGFIGSAVSLL